MNHKLLGVLLVGLVSSVGACVDQTGIEEDQTSTTEQASHNAPDPEDELYASAVADAMVDRILALLFREFAVTTPENAAVGTDAISNVFHNGNPLMRLVGDVDPLQRSNYPADDFERDALAAAKLGQNFSRTERIRGRWWVRKSIAVSNAFSPTCVFCHSNFDNLSNQWVGFLAVRAEVD